MFFSVLQDEPNYDPNPTDLATLADDGIDVSFLDAFSPNAPVPELKSMSEILHVLATLLPKLLDQQNNRLVSRSRELINEAELSTAEQAQDALLKALKLTAPGAACSVEAIRKAMGISS